MIFRCYVALAMVLLLCPQAFADIDTGAPSAPIPTPPRVTLESCGDLRAEDILRILAAEHQNFDYSQTKVMVACTSNAATVRVVGPNNPRGRILHADLSSVQPVAWPRTIALIVAELSPTPELVAPGLVAEAEQKEEPRVRRKSTLGVGLLFARRSSSHTSGGSRDFSMPLVNVNVSVPVGRWIGIYGSVSLNHFATYAQDGGSEVPLTWTRQEYGLFVPVWNGPLSIEITYSLISDSTVIGMSRLSQEQRRPLPTYGMHTLGLGASLAWDSRTSIEATVASHAMSRDQESGYTMGLGLTYQLRDSYKLGFTLEQTGYDGQDLSGHYTDDYTMAGTSLTYSR